MDIEPRDYIDEGGRVNMCRAWENTKRISREEGRLEGEQIGLNRGRLEGRLEGKNEGKVEILSLMQVLFETGRVEDAKKAANDRDYCNLLIKELGLN